MPLPRESLTLAGMLAAEDLEPFIYRVAIAVPAATVVATQLTNNVQITSDANFHCHSVRARLTSDAIGRVMTIDGNDGTDENGGWPDCPARIQIQDGGKDRLWHSDAVGSSLAYPASGESLPTFRMARFVAASTTLLVLATLTKVVAAASTIEVLFYGIKDYRLRPRIAVS